jgi:flap endonuclease-1
MGIQNLSKILKSKAPNAMVKRSLSSYMGYRVAIDTSIFLYKYMFVYGNVIDGLTRLVLVLLQNGILPVFVLDGKPPKEKSELLKERKEKREELIDIVHILKYAYEQKDENPQFEHYNKDEIKGHLKKYGEKNFTKRGYREHLLSEDDWNMIYDVTPGSQETFEKYIKEMERKIIRITKEHIKDVQKLMELFGVPCIIAQSEAESLCSVLCKKGIVDAVMSEDMDVLATGGCILLKNFSMEKGGSVIEVSLDGVLKELEMEFSSFLDMCIMCGCDYTSKIGGIGPTYAYKLMKKHGNIETAMPYIKSNKSYKVPNDFDYVTSRALFNDACKNDNFEKYKSDVLQTPIQEEELVQFLNEKTKLKGKIFGEIEDLAKSYKNEKKGYQKVDENDPNDISMVLKNNPKLKYQPTLDNYFKKSTK